MRFIWHLLAVLLLLALLAVSTVGVMAYMPSFGGRLIRLNAMGNSIIDTWRPTNGLFFLWLGLFVGTLLALITGALSLRRQKKISVQMGGGRVVILESAIRKYVRTALLDIPDITARKIRLLTTRNGIDVEVRVHVKTNQKLPDLERKVIDRVRTALAEELGIASVGSVHVSVLDVELANRPEPVRRNRGDEKQDEVRPEDLREEAAGRAVVLRPPTRRSQPLETAHPVVVVNPEHTAQIFEPYRPAAGDSGDETLRYGFREEIKDQPSPGYTGMPSAAREVNSSVPPASEARDTLFVAGDLEDVPATVPEGQKNIDVTAAGDHELKQEAPSAEQIATDAKKKRRGLFGLWGRDEADAVSLESGEGIGSGAESFDGSATSPETPADSLFVDSDADSDEAKDKSQSGGQVDRT